MRGGYFTFTLTSSRRTRIGGTTKPLRRAYMRACSASRATMLTTNPFDDDKLREECGVFGMWGADSAAAIVALGLHALQHRGQEAAGHHQLRRRATSTAIAAWAMSPAYFDEDEVMRAARRAAPRSAMSAIRPPAAPALRNVQPLFAELASGRLRGRA